jgi:hypothetical protein
MSHEEHDEIEDHEGFFLIKRPSCPSTLFVVFVATGEH